MYGLDSIKYNEIKDQVQIDASRIKKINVNTANFDDFKFHPYIRYKQVNALIQYRKQHGNYSNIADLNKVVILDQETIDRLTAYLEF
ncbi:Helix-hairpin-helix motif protein [compost metagenome]